jgi:uncharacterized protein YceK
MRIIYLCGGFVKRRGEVALRNQALSGFCQSRATAYPFSFLMDRLILPALLIW